MVKARNDMSYENPIVGPSDALVSNWKKCGWRLILFAHPVRASSGISFLKMMSTQSYTFPRMTNGSCFFGVLRTSASSSCNT